MRSESYEAIRDYMAKTFFAFAWADWQEEYGDISLSGVEIMDAIPEEYPDTAYMAADILIKKMEEINGLDIKTIFEICRGAPGEHRREPDADEFGYCMAMQAMGHGVGWDDNHPSMFHNNPRFKVPHVEYSYFDLPENEYPIPVEQ